MESFGCPETSGRPKLSRAASALQTVMGEGHMGDVDEIFNQAVIALGSVQSASGQAQALLVMSTL